ncbi:MAG: FecR domain-containing protein [Deltaproteobacteria bacterium]|nr:FecR domain-containing protein [Deltaproteobacteria bacterium]
MRNPIPVVLLLSLSWLLLGAAPPDPCVELTVVHGDNLVNISKKYLEDSTRWREIARVNRLGNPDLIYPGQKLIVPVRLLKGVPADGVVAFVKGDAEVCLKKEGTWRKVRLNDRILRGSRLKTGDGSTVEIAFEDGDSLLVRSNTDIEMALMEKKGLFHRVYKFFLDAGRTVSKVKQATGQETRFEVQTPSALAMARGTGFRLAVNTENTTRCEVLEGEVGVQGRKGSVSVGEGEGTVVQKDAAPMKPRRLLPPPALLDRKSVYKILPLEFAFDTVEGAASSRIMLSGDEEGKDVVREGFIRPGEGFQVVQLEDGVYFLRSISVDEVGLEGPALSPVAIHLRVNPLPPYTQKPVQEAEYVEKSVEVRWLRVKDAAEYQVQVSGDAGFEKVRMDRRGLKELGFTTEPLDEGAYYLRARSVAADGYEGGWSKPLRFTVIPPPPSPPVQKPEMAEDRIQIRWDTMGEGYRYHFQMSGDEAFHKALVDKVVEEPQINLERPEKAGTYYVRTSTIDPKGREGDFSSPQSFDVEEVFPYGILGAIFSTLLIIILL